LQAKNEWPEKVLLYHRNVFFEKLGYN